MDRGLVLQASDGGGFHSKSDEGPLENLDTGVAQYDL